MMNLEVCPRCAVLSDYPNHGTRSQARKFGAIGDTRNHAPEDCIKHLRDAIDDIIRSHKR